MTATPAPNLAQGRRPSNGKIAAVTAACVMLAELLIGAPSLATVRLNWLEDRLAAAFTAAQVLEAAPNGVVPDSLAEELLASVGAHAVAVKKGTQRRLLAVADMPPVVDSVDIRDRGAFAGIAATAATLLSGGSGAVRVVGPAPLGSDYVAIVIDEAPLRHALLHYLGNLAAMAALTAGIAALMLYLTLRYLGAAAPRRTAATTI